jgi:sugar lactone lactonase YvrE
VVAAIATTLAAATTTLAFAGELAAPALAQQDRARFDTRVLAQIPSPGFGANSLVAPDGTIYVGSFENPAGDNLPSRVFRFAPDGALESSYTILGQDLKSPHGVQVAAIDASGVLYLLDQTPARMLKLDPRTGHQEVYATFRDVPSCATAPAGAECSQTLADNAPEPDYAAWAPDGSLYVTDYLQGLIWRVPPGGGAAHVWFSDPRFDGVQFDAAGIVLKPDLHTLLVDTAASSPTTGPNFTDGKLYELPIGADGKPGALRQLWESGPTQAPDGFAVAQSGNIYMALVGPGANELVEISPTGEQLAVTPSGALANQSLAVPYDEPSSVQFSGQRLIVTNLSYLAGNAAHQVLFDVWAGEPGMPIYHPPAPIAPASAARSHAAPSLQVTVAPHAALAGSRVRYRFRVTTGSGGSGLPVAGATIRFAGRSARTHTDGHATLTLTLHRTGVVHATVTKHGYAPASVAVFVSRGG